MACIIYLVGNKIFNFSSSTVILLINLNNGSVEKNSKKWGGQGGAPLGVPPPLGERGGHPPILKNISK